MIKPYGKILRYIFAVTRPTKSYTLFTERNPMRILDLSDFILSVTIITVMMPLYVGGWILDSTLELLPIGSKIRVF